jgi:hypothetical protein
MEIAGMARLGFAPNAIDLDLRLKNPVGSVGFVGSVVPRVSRTGAAADFSSPPRAGGFEKKTPRSPGRLGPRNSSFQHLGMIEGVLGDETFLGA